jgi:hypothetical protein
MPDQQQPPNWFTGQETSDDGDFAKRKAQLLEELPKLLGRQNDRGRANSFYPYLLVRSLVGDRGDRPFNQAFWESPDIWTAAGDPEHSPAIPANHGGVVTAGQPNTVYAHVWNLGFAPLAGVVVEFYWFNPSLGIDGSDANLIGIGRCELAARGMAGSHQLVKCPKPWVPVMENGGHECLVVRVYGIGDPLGNNDWQPWLNRHIAQRNVSVVAQQNLGNLFTRLGAIKTVNRLQLVQLAAKEGEVAAKIVAPRTTIPVDTATHVLSELNAQRQVVVGQRLAPQAATLAPFHPLTTTKVPAAPVLKAPGAVPVVATAALVAHLAPDVRAAAAPAPAGPKPAAPPPAAPTPAAAKPAIPLRINPAAEAAATPSLVASITSMFASVPELHPGAQTLPSLKAGQVNVLRLANLDAGGQLVGGYTLVVEGS